MHHFEIVHTGFASFPWEAAIDGWMLRSTHGRVRRFQTNSAAIQALRREAIRQGIEYSIPHERHENYASKNT